MALSRDWMADAACRGRPLPGFWLDPRQHPALYQEAVAFCIRCPVSTLCYAYGAIRDEIGLWGGTPERERHARRRYVLPILVDLWPDLLEQWRLERGIVPGRL